MIRIEPTLVTKGVRRCILIVLLAVLFYAEGALAQSPSDYLYWTDRQENIIYRGSAGGHDREVLLTHRSPARYAVRDSLLAWVDNSLGATDFRTIRWTVIGSATTDTLMTTGSKVRQLEFGPDDQALYWTEESDTLRRIHRAALNQTTSDTLLRIPEETAIYEISAETKHIYWIQAGSIRRKALDGADETVLIEDAAGSNALALDTENGDMYWLREGAIYRAGIDGSDVELLNSNAPDDARLDVIGEQYFWTEGDSLIKRASMDGSQAEVLIHRSDLVSTGRFDRHLRYLRIDGPNGYLYFRTDRGGIPAPNVWRLDSEEGAAETVLVGFRVPAGVTVDRDGRDLYWTAGQGKVLRSDLDGTAVREIANAPCGIGRTTDIVFDGVDNKVYWGYITDCPSNDIYRSAPDGTDLELARAYNEPIALALDPGEDRLYWTEHSPYSLDRAEIDSLFGRGGVENMPEEIHAWGIAFNAETDQIYWTDPNDGVIKRADNTGQNIETLVSGLQGPRDLSLNVNDGEMYWTEQEAGTIRKARLDGSNVETLFAGLNAPEYLALTFETRQVLNADRPADLPQKVRLHGNYPNPFNPSTTILYDLVRSTDVKIHVYDVVGRKVATLVDRIQSAGRHTVSFDGSYLPSGMYLYRLETPAATLTKQMLLLK